MRGKHLFFFLLVGLAACGKGDFFSQDQSIQGQEWDSKQKISFEVEVKDTTQYYDFYIDFRHNDNYPYSEIYFLFDIDFPNGKGTHDTVHYVMQGPDGRWFGHKSGSMIDNHVLIKQKTAFPVSGKYRFHIRHLMRDEKLPGIEDVGISITTKN